MIHALVGITVVLTLVGGSVLIPLIGMEGFSGTLKLIRERNAS